MGHRPRRGLPRHLCDRHRMVANQSELAVGRLHRPAMALLARRLLRSLLFRSQPTATPPLVIQALRMLWFGCGIFLSLFSVVVIVAGDMRQGWFNAVAAGIFGIAFFVSSYLCNLAWMRWVAAGWWGAALLLYALRHRLEVLPLSAVLILVLLALPGLLLWRGRPAGA